MKRVLMLLTNAFDPDPRVHQEAKSLVIHGYDVSIICWDRDYKNPPFEVIDGIKIERIYVRSTHGRGITQIFFLPLFWLTAFLRIFTREFDIIHCHDFDTLPLGFMLAKLRRKPIIYDAHESFADMLYQSLPHWMIQLIRTTENILIKRINLLITVGTILEEEFKKRGARRTCVVGNWKNPEDYIFPPEIIAKTKKELGIPENKLVVSYIGHFTKERKIKELIEAVSQAENTHLLLGGDGPTREEVKGALTSAKNVTYLGYVLPNKIPLYTAVSDVIAYIFDANNPNARFSAPNKLFEALAAGKAVITGDFGEIGKIVKECGCGIIFEDVTIPKILVILNSLSLNGGLKNYQSNALAAGKRKYNWQKTKEILMENYQKI